MAELKTKVNDASVADFLNAITDTNVRQDCWTIVDIMQKAAQAGPRMWGSNIVGFGQFPLVYPDGRQIDWMMIGFSPRKKAITLYLMNNFDQFSGVLAKLGKYTRGKSCLYIKRLADVNLPVLEQLVSLSLQQVTSLAKSEHGKATMSPDD